MPDKIPFDYLGARKEGYSDQEIMGFLKQNYGFDFDLVGARKEGYSDQELADYIAAYDVKKKSRWSFARLRRGAGGCWRGAKRWYQKYVPVQIILFAVVRRDAQSSHGQDRPATTGQ